METARLKGVTWAIVKRRLQLNADPLPDRDAVMRLVEKEFAPYRVLSGYEIYRRR
jgi:hypothetical protein